MKLILFLLYYCKLKLSVLLGFHKTYHPMDLNWRWNYWQDKYRRRRSR
ncbi:MAG TPA: hypothetical protein VF571_02585 [Pyrinomonadaceae bacterium]